jgi:hypothetical protein
MLMMQPLENSNQRGVGVMALTSRTRPRPRPYGPVAVGLLPLAHGLKERQHGVGGHLWRGESVAVANLVE